MKTLHEILSADEGMKLVVYDDATGKAIVPGSVVVGHPTIGMGRALDTRGISNDEAALLSTNDEKYFSDLAAKSFRWFESLSQARQLVIVCMLFQLGIGGVLEFRGMIAAIQKGDWNMAADQMLDSHWAKEQTPKRAERLSAMMRQG